MPLYTDYAADGSTLKICTNSDHDFDMDGLDDLWQDWVTQLGQPAVEEGLHLELEIVVD